MNEPAISPPRHRLAEAVAWFLITFLVLFPKGGIKVGGLPLTWGYLGIVLSIPGLLLVRLLSMPLRLRPSNLAATASVIPFTLLFCYSIKANGTELASYAFSTFVTLCILPPIFLLLYADFLRFLDGRWLERNLRRAMFAAAVFGIFLFVWHPLTGHFIEIPLLTVNADDYGTLETSKNIDRGFFLKLISTYNNGNVYGVATLILLPLFDLFEPKRWKRNLMKLALVLTLSRTVWAGLILIEVFSLAKVALQALRTFPRVVFGPALKTGMILVATLGLVLVGLALISQNVAFLFDSKLGGRSETIATAIASPTLLPALPVIAIAEIVYASVLSQYGILGLLSVILIFGFPIVLVLLNPACLEDLARRAALKGIMLYMFLAAVDGAINLIPVMVFYWFTYMIFLEGWPAPRGSARTLAPVLPGPAALPSATPRDAFAFDQTPLRGSR